MSFTRLAAPSSLSPDRSEAHLHPAATRGSQSLGRRHPEPEHPYRPCFVRDRDRVIHSSAFRRLMYKTQVFVSQPSDHQRTRLTHTLEVAQIARTVARYLGLNEDLTETVALAHDLGHPPFGHAGERALADLTQSVGGFEHNRQGVRVVEILERRYPAFPGLNLTYETLESIGLHSKQRSHPDLAEFHPECQMRLESQVVDLSDSIAYNAHDIDDAIHSSLITIDDLRTVGAWRIAEEKARFTYGPKLDGRELILSVLRSLIDWHVGSLLKESQRRLEGMRSPEEAMNARDDVVALEPDVAREKKALERFLFQRVYRHEAVLGTTRRAERMVRQLFEELVRDPTPLPPRYQERRADAPLERIVCDYVAGMTDRYAQHLHRKLFQP